MKHKLLKWATCVIPIILLVLVCLSVSIPEYLVSAQINNISLDSSREASYAPTTITNSPTTNTGSAWANPTYAYTDDSSQATLSPGNPSGSNVYGGYGFSLTGNVIQSVKVRYDSYNSATLGTIGARTAGTVAYGTTGVVTPGLPYLDVYDVCIMVASTITGGSISITNNGSIGTWTPITGSPVNVASGEKLYVWWGRYSSGSTAPSLQAGSDHIVARISAYYNVSTDANPIDVVTTGTETTSDTSFSFDTGLTTTANNEMCIAVCSTGYDGNSTTMFSTMANTSLTSLQERMDNVRNSGGGGGFGMAQGVKATVGTMGTWTSTLTYASPKAYIAFALKQCLNSPQIKVDVSCDGGTTWIATQNTILTANETTYWYDVTSLVVWTPSKLTDTNFKVRALAQTLGNITQVRLDWLAVEVVYEPCDVDYVAPSISEISTNYFEITAPHHKIKAGNTSKATNFVPEITIGKWDDESWFTLTPDSTTLASFGSLGTATLSNGIVTAENSAAKVVYNATEPAIGFNELGGLDYVITYKSKPSINTLTYTYNSQSANAYLQPALTQEEIDEGSIRPDYVVNSVAFYGNENQVNNIVGGTQYKTGKIGHLYRMKAIDAVGAWVWTDWSVGTGTVSLSISQSFLDNATYPVTIAPVGDTFGITTVGATDGTWGVDYWRGEYATVSSSGNVVGLAIYNPGGTLNYKGVLSDSSLTIVSNGVSPAFASNGLSAWFTVEYSTFPTVTNGNSYWAGAVCDSGAGYEFRYDTVTADGTHGRDTSNSYASPTSPTDAATNRTTKMSLYFVYVPATSPATLTDFKDNFLYQYAADSNYGANSDIDVLDRSGRGMRSILEFNSLGLPAGQTITSAYLNLYYYSYVTADPVGKVIYAYKKSTTTWGEFTSTWNTDAADYVTSSPSGGSVAVPASYGWMQWDVTAIVQDAYTNAIKTEFLLRYETEGLSSGYGTTKWYSKEITSSANKPYLTINFSPAASAPTITISAASSVEATTATLNGNVTATGGENPTVTVYWGDNDGGTTPGSWDNNAAPTSPAQPQGVASFYYSATSLSTGTTYYFAAKATNSGGTDWDSASLTFLTKPAAPTDVAATDGTYPDKVTITWTKSSGTVTGYKIYRDASLANTVGDVATGDDTGGGAPTITPGTSTATEGSSTSYTTVSVSGESASNGTTYSYTVKAYNATGDSSASSGNNGYRGTTTLTYQWYRSSGDADSDYSSVGGGTTDPYNDSGVPPTITPGTASATDGDFTDKVTLSLAGEQTNLDERYWKCLVSMTGATPQYTSIDRGWTGVGSLTYQWQRSAADSDASYSNIGSATTDPYDDTGGVVTPDGRYYKCVLDATGATQQTSTSNRGYMAASATPSITNTPNSYDFGDTLISATPVTGLDNFTVTNNTGGGNAVDITIGGTDMTSGSGGTMQQMITGGHSANSLNTTTTEYNMVMGHTSWTSDETYVIEVIPTDGTISTLIVRLDADAGTSPDAYEFTLMVNSSPSTLTCTIVADNTTGSDLVHTVDVSAGDLVSIRCVPIETPSATPHAIYSVIFESDTPNESIFMGVVSSQIDNYYITQGKSSYSEIETLYQAPVPTSGVFKKLYARLRTAATTYSNTVNTVSVEAGDLIAYKTTHPSDYHLILRVNGADTGLDCDTDGYNDGYTGISMVFLADVNGESIIMGGGEDQPSVSATEYYYMEGYQSGTEGAWSATETSRYNLSNASTLSDLYVKLSAAPDNGGGTQSYQITVRVNGGDSTITVAISEANTTGNDTTHTVSPTSGQVMDMSSTPSGTPTVTYIHWGIVSYIEPGAGELWTLSDTATIGTDTCGIMAGLDGGSYNIIVKKTAPYNTLKSNLADTAAQDWGLELLAPDEFTFWSVELTGTITLTASLHV